MAFQMVIMIERAIPIGTLDSTDGTADNGYYSYTINKKGSICFINQLAGLEKGDNDFYIYTKGSEGDTVQVAFYFPANNYKSIYFRFPATSSSWCRYGVAQSVNGTTSINIPLDVSYCNIQVSCLKYISGTVKVSGFVLGKKLMYL